MKKLVPLILLAMAFNGCSLIPHKVEFFQDKVKKVPELTSSQREVEKRAALAAKFKAAETLTAAIGESASTNVILPATDAAKLTDVVSEMVGPPARPSTASTDKLVQEVRAALAKQDSKLESFKRENNENAGKKIEGTGLLQIPYFVYVGLIALVILVAWHLLHTVLTGLQVAGVANPALGVAGGVGSALMGGVESVFSKGFSQVVKGGEKFKSWVGAEVEDPALRKKILDAFASAHKEAQDETVQTAVKLVTSK